MSNREQISPLLEKVAPDEWDLQMIADAKRDNDGATATFEEMIKKDGLTYADLRD